MVGANRLIDLHLTSFIVKSVSPLSFSPSDVIILIYMISLRIIVGGLLVCRFYFFFESCMYCIAWNSFSWQFDTLYKVYLSKPCLRDEVGWVVVDGAFGVDGRWIDSTSSRHEGTLGKSFARNCLYDVMLRPVAGWRLNSTPVIACYLPFILYL